MKNILIIDDDRLFCEALIDMAHDHGHKATGRYNLAEGLETAATQDYDIVFLDINLPDGNGLDILPDLKTTTSQPEVVIITGTGTHNGARLAIENGAWDYIQKGDLFEQINLSFLRVLEYRKEKKASKPIALKRSKIIGESSKIQACLDLVAQAAASDVNVLITGSTGTGKELFARTIHENSLCSKKPFTVLDCTVLPETLVESILFGHEKGAFTGADKKHDGLVAQAHGGTLFLDEVGELPLCAQKSFLRVLEDGKFRTVGGKKEIKSDFRLIAATNRDLDQMVKSGDFREDLLYRIRALTIHLPTLAQRFEDIRLMTRYFLDKICQESGVGIKGISPAFYEALEIYHWPGNVRELIHALENAFAASFGNTLIPQHLPKEIRINMTQVELNNIYSKDMAELSSLADFKSYRKTMTSEYLKDLMDVTKGNVREACRISGVSRSRLYDLLKIHEIEL